MELQISVESLFITEEKQVMATSSKDPGIRKKNIATFIKNFDRQRGVFRLLRAEGRQDSHLRHE